MEEKVFTFKGGSRDGERFRGTNFSVGAPMRKQPVGPQQRVEIYVLHADDCFHFDRYGLAFNPAASSLAILDELKPIMNKLADVFKEMDAVYEKAGGPGAGDTIVGNWRICHKDA